MCVPTMCSTYVIEIHDFKDPYTWKTAKANQSKFEMYVHYSRITFKCLRKNWIKTTKTYIQSVIKILQYSVVTL